MPESSKFDWVTTAQFLFSISAVFLSFVITLVGFLIIFIGDQLVAVSIPKQQVISSYLFLAGIGFVGVLLIPSTITSGKTLLGIHQQEIHFLDNAWWLVFFVPLFIGFVNFFGGMNALQVAAFLLIHLLTNGAITFWMIYLLRNNLPKSSSQRFWGIFGSGLALAPFIALIVEMLLLVGIIIIWIAYLQTQPALFDEITALLNRLPQSAVSPPIMERMAENYLARPGVLGTLFVYVAVLIPVLEELIKPIGVWIMLGRKLSPWEGFILGGISGAGYALFENLTIGANADLWTAVVISRFGTTAIHILTSGLVGWGLVSAWTESRFLRLGMAYFSAVLIHGVWNGLNVVNIITTVPGLSDGLGAFMVNFAGYAPVGLVILSLGSLIGVLIYNKYFQRAIMTQVYPTK